MSGPITKEALQEALELQYQLSNEQAVQKPEARPAAVVLALSGERPSSLLAIVRSKELRDHAGEVAFAGGKQDPEDADLISAAAREFQEELGVSSTFLEIVGPLPGMPSINGRFWIQPYVGWLAGEGSLEFQPNPGEVASLVWLDLAAYLWQGKAIYAYDIQWQGKTLRTYHFPLKGVTLFGASAAFLMDLLMRLAQVLQTGELNILVDDTPGWTHHNEGTSPAISANFARAALYSLCARKING